MKIIDAPLEQQIIGTNKKFILQGLLGVGDFWPSVLDKVFHLGGGLKLHLQNAIKNLAHDIAEALGDFMGVDQEFHAGPKGTH